MPPQSQNPETLSPTPTARTTRPQTKRRTAKNPMPTITAPDTLQSAVLHEALTGLVKPAGEQKCLSPWLFYDTRGSQLFEDITRLPEYYLTRTERAIFEQYGPSLTQHLAAPQTIAELGAGSASKTGILLRDFAAAQDGVLYQPIDISPSALDEAATSIRAELPGVSVMPQVANYITDTYDIHRPTGHKVLALYIGSSIGNFSPADGVGILRNLRAHLLPGDALLLGTDLAPGPQKSVATLTAAYDDAAGVTAAFNKNVLTRLNRELECNFVVDCFRHHAIWNAHASRMEMHLESLIAQTVTIPGLDGQAAQRIHFEAGETIHTENSYKFTPATLRQLLDTSGFEIDQTLHDPDHRFAVTLAKAL